MSAMHVKPLEAFSYVASRKDQKWHLHYNLGYLLDELRLFMAASDAKNY